MVNDYEYRAAFDEVLMAFVGEPPNVLFLDTITKHVKANVWRTQFWYNDNIDKQWWDIPAFAGCAWLVYGKYPNSPNLRWIYDFTTEKSRLLYSLVNGVLDEDPEYWFQYGLATAEEMRIDVLHQVYLHVFQWCQTGVFYLAGGYSDEGAAVDGCYKSVEFAEGVAEAVVEELLTLFRMPGNPFDKWDRSSQAVTV